MSNKAPHNFIPRPPVVVVMGHIDHGKSTLLDYIRKTNIVEGEAGGITQHVGAYQVEYVSTDGKKHPLTFLDTPGHAAFCGIRERGAQAADIAILAVSSEDGVKPQTLEAFKAIKSAKIPYVVAITKIDKPNANVERTKQTLGENEIYVEGWGGDVPCVAVSAVSGAGINELFDMIILMAELASLKTNPSSVPTGMVIEVGHGSDTGISATLLVRDGQLKIGTFIVAGDAFTPVRFIEDFQGHKITTATASTPASIVGWNKVPICGTPFTVVATKKEAEEIATEYGENNKVEVGSMAEDNSGIVILPLIIKADTTGSLDGVKHELAKITHDKIKLKIINAGIGEINENDIRLALSNPNVIIIGFNTTPQKKAKLMIERSAVPIVIGSFKIIYDLVEFVRSKFMERVPKEYVEEIMGRAKILALFSKERDKQVVGGKVESGVIGIGTEVRIMRREVEIGRGKIKELQAKKIKASEVAEGHECGMLIEAKIELAIGDRIESVRTVEKV